MDRRAARIITGRWTIRVAGCMLMLASCVATGQTATKHTPSMSPSTLSGVFTAEQASRGKDVYAGNCKSCHTPASHTGATFATWWRGKRLSDLFWFITTKMPKNDPGSLAPEDAADVVAYLLQMNSMPAGKEEMPPDLDSLQHIRIAIKRAGMGTRHSRPITPAKRKKP